MLGHNGQDGDLFDFLQWLAHSFAHEQHAQCFHFPPGSSWIVLVFTGSTISRQIAQRWSYSIAGPEVVAAVAKVLFLFERVFILKSNCVVLIMSFLDV
jgi:hypothetical protein